MNAPQQPEIGRSDPDDPSRFVGTYLTERPASPWRSRPAHWAIAVAGVAAVVCLVGWPRPTLYALGAVAVAVALLVGLQLLLAEHAQTDPAADQPTSLATAHANAARMVREANTRTEEAQQSETGAVRARKVAEAKLAAVRRVIADDFRHDHRAMIEAVLNDPQSSSDSPDCAEHPDPSGLRPDESGPGADEPGRQATDQPGDDPDDLRTRLADAIRTALKERTLPPLTLYGHQAFPGIGLTEYDLADVALAVMQRQLSDLHWEVEAETKRADRADTALTAALRTSAREAAAMLRRTPRDSRDYPAVLTGARVIETWLATTNRKDHHR